MFISALLKIVDEEQSIWCYGVLLIYPYYFLGRFTFSIRLTLSKIG